MDWQADLDRRLKDPDFAAKYNKACAKVVREVNRQLYSRFWRFWRLYYRIKE